MSSLPYRTLRLCFTSPTTEHTIFLEEINKSEKYNQTSQTIFQVEIAHRDSCTIQYRLSEKENWNVLPGELLEGPSLYRGTFQVNSEPRDTFLLMEGWTKGVCFINGHNLGRYWNVGPQMTLYVPGPWLRKGENYVSSRERMFVQLV